MNLATLQRAATDLFVVLGLLAFFYGLWLAWHPLGFIVGGLTVAAVSFMLGYDPARIRGVR